MWSGTLQSLSVETSDGKRSWNEVWSLMIIVRADRFLFAAQAKFSVVRTHILGMMRHTAVCFLMMLKQKAIVCIAVNLWCFQSQASVSPSCPTLSTRWRRSCQRRSANADTPRKTTTTSRCCSPWTTRSCASMAKSMCRTTSWLWWTS